MLITLNLFKFYSNTLKYIWFSIIIEAEIKIPTTWFIFKPITNTLKSYVYY